MKTLTKRQSDALSFIKAFFPKNGRMPRLGEIGDEFGFSRPAAFDLVSSLEKKGMLEKSADGTIVLTEGERKKAVNTLVPFYDGDEVKTAWVPSENGDDVIMVTVWSDEMKDAGVLRGDRAVFRLTDTAENGDIVIALLPDGETHVLRRYFRRPDGLVDLFPENSTMGKITSSGIRIKARMSELIRRIN